MLKQQIEKYIKKAVGQDVKVDVFIPEDERHGYFSTNVALKLAKEMRKKLMEIANDLKSQISNLKSGIFEKIEVAAPGFINFWLTKEAVQKEFNGIYKAAASWGKSRLKIKKTIVVEYSSPNIAKPLGVHHLRSTIIGQAIVDVLRFAGYRAISLSFPGDWGTQFGLLIAAYKRWGSPEKIKKEPINEMLKLYVKFSEAAKKNPKLLDEGRGEFKKLEQGDKENLKLWKWFLDESMMDFERVYKLLGVKIDHTIGESFYEPELKALVENALARGVAQKGKDGSVVVSIPGSAVPEIIQKSDGATIYTTRELAAIRHRLKKWKADKILYAAANQQSFHLEQVFRAAEILGIAKRNQLGHIKFGMMLAPGGKKFATREGRLIPLENVLNEAIERSRKVVEKLNPKLSKKEKEKIAQAVGIGAVKFFDLSQNRFSDIVFDWDKMLDLKGSSAPYIQYTYARLKSILRKGKLGKFNARYLEEDIETKLILQLEQFPDVVQKVAQTYFPHYLTDYLYELAKNANNFYQFMPVLKAAQNERQARLALIKAVSEVIKTGLNLLGIKALERM